MIEWRSGDWVVYAGSDVTGIRSVESETTNPDVRYNLCGQRVSRDYKGVVIV